MKKVSFIILGATAPLLLHSCNTNDTAGTPPSTTDRTIGIDTYIEATSLMGQYTPVLNEEGQGNFADGSSFTLQISTPDGVRSNCFDYTVGSTVLYWKNLALAPEDETVHFAACYPMQTLAEGQFTFDLMTADEKDLLLARTTEVPVGTETPVPLTFRHAMHRLVVRFSADPGTGPELNEVQTVCTALASCEVNLNDGLLDTKGACQGTFTGIGSQVDFLIVPQSPADVSLEVTAGSSSRSFSLADLTPQYDILEGGMQLTVNLTLVNGTIELAGTTIAGWGDQGSVEGEIIL